MPQGYRVGALDRVVEVLEEENRRTELELREPLPLPVHREAQVHEEAPGRREVLPGRDEWLERSDGHGVRNIEPLLSR
jgi:ribosomal protein S10